MKKLQFNFDENSFNELFPFYFLIDSEMTFKGIGKSLSKTLPEITNNDTFKSIFRLQNPNVNSPSFQDVLSITNQEVLITATIDTFTLRGQFQKHNGGVLFVGTPFFTSINQLSDNKLTKNDFAPHNPSLEFTADAHEVVSEDMSVYHGNQEDYFKSDQEELNRLSLVASANENGVVFTKSNGKIFWCNDAYLKLTGFSKQEVLGKTPIELGKCAETSEEELLKMIIPFMKGELFNVEHLHRRKNKNSFWVKTKGQPILDAHGKVIQYFAMIEDITEKKYADFKRIESENRLSFLILNLQTGVILEDENRKLLLINKKFCNLFDIKEHPDDLIGADCSNSIQDSKHFYKNPESYVERFEAILSNNEPVYNEELELIDGRFFERSFIPIFRNGIYKGNLRSYVDITIKKNHEELLRNEKEKYSRIIANMNLGLIEVDDEEKIVFANNSFCDFSGYSIDELINKKASDLLLTDESKQIIKEKNLLRIKGITDSYEIQVKNKKGAFRHWLVSGAPNYDVNGKVKGSIGIHLDITKQKEQEEKLYLLSLIAEKNINAVIISDLNGKIEWVNSSFERMSGYKKEELLGKKPGHLLQGPETDLQTVDYLRNQIKTGQPFNCEIINYSKSGEKYWVKVQGQALYNKNGEIVRFFAIEEDITDKKILENHREELVNNLAKTNKELEDYAQIVSHDLKSPLRSIHSLISWIKEDSDKVLSNQSLEFFSMIEHKVEKMDHLIEGILTYSKIDKEEAIKESVDVQAVVQNIIDIIHIPQHISVVIVNELPVVKADRYRVQQLFQNLIGNAVNYIEREIGLVEVSAEEFEDHYIFSVKDNGVGIDKKNHKRIFDTFQSFTTSKHSTGLGLSIVKKIIESFNAQIWIESEVGVGTTFFIKLNK